MKDITRRLGRAESAAYLTSLGYKVAAKTLAKLACVGGWPDFVKFGHRPLYTPADLVEWAEAKTSNWSALLRSSPPIMGSTDELSV